MPKPSDYLPTWAERASRDKPETDHEMRIKRSLARDIFDHFERVGNAEAMRDMSRGWGKYLDKH